MTKSNDANNNCGKLRYTLPLLLILLQLPAQIYGRRITHRRMIIHVPIKVKTHHHTHTVFKHIHTNSGVKQTVYKILGYSSHNGLAGGGGGGGSGGGVGVGAGSSSDGGMKFGGGHGLSHGHGHGHSHGHGHGHGHGMSMMHADAGHGEITYEDMHGCESGHLGPGSSHRDMIFNHYSRHDDDYREDDDDDDEFVDVEQADWL